MHMTVAMARLVCIVFLLASFSSTCISQPVHPSLLYARSLRDCGDEGGVPFQDQCYYFRTEAVPWTVAEIACRHYGSDVKLVTITNQDQQEWLMTNAGQYSNTWIGLADSQGSWQWVDGTFPNYTDWWNVSQPQNSSGENCVAMSAPLGHWRNWPCGTSKPYVCSFQVNFPEGQQILCQGGWPFQDQCYWFSREQRSWAKADSACRWYGEDKRLVTITNQEQQEWLSSMMRNEDLWIGLHDLHKEGNWRWLDDDTYPNYTNWAPSQPTNATDANCVAISPSGDWYDRSCNNMKYYVCSSVNNSICHSGGIFFRDRCYWQSERAMTWANAHDYCSRIEEGVDIVIIRDGELNEFLWRFLHYHIWIGLHDNFHENHWRWIDGSKPTFTNWAEDEPNDDYENGEDCTHMTYTTGMWNDIVCNYVPFNVICALTSHCVGTGPDGKGPCASPYCSCVSGGSCIGTGQCECVEIFSGMECDKAKVQVQLQTADQVAEGGTIELKCHVNIPKVDYSLQVEHIRTRDLHSPQVLPVERTHYYTTNDEENGYYEVAIYNATAEDTGSYVCIVSTTAGVVPVTRFDSAYVKVGSDLNDNSSSQLVPAQGELQGGAGLTIPITILAVFLVILLIILMGVLIQLRRKKQLPCSKGWRTASVPNEPVNEEGENLCESTHTL